MADILDVAEYILRARGQMSAMKLQKLCYYAQAWHLVWEEDPLFAEDFQAWANGPVSYPLYDRHRGRLTVSPGDIGGFPEALSSDEAESVDIVLKTYASMKPFELSELTHRERPWRNARGDLPPGARSNMVIPKDEMLEYYDSLLAASRDF